MSKALPNILSNIFKAVKSSWVTSEELVYCKKSLQQHHKGYFQATGLLKGDCRQAGFAIRAFGIELDKAYVKDAKEAEGKFQFWRQNIHSIYEDGSVINPHPVAVELLKTVKSSQPPNEYLLDMITAKEVVYKNKGINSMTEFNSYAKFIYSAQYLFLLHVLDKQYFENDNILILAYKVGQCEAVMDVIKTIKQKAELEIVNIPKTILFDHNLTREDVLYSTDLLLLTEVTADMANYCHKFLMEIRSQIEGEIMPIPLRMIFTTVPIICTFFKDLSDVKNNVYSSRIQFQTEWPDAIKYIVKSRQERLRREKATSSTIKD